MDIRSHDTAEITAALVQDSTLCNALIPDESLPAEQHVTMLWQAAAFGDSELLALFCRQPSAAVDFQRSADGVSPLYVAAQNGHLECSRTLLQHGADVNIRRRTGATPLFIAVQKDRAPIAKLLLDRDADPNLTNDQHATPFVLACNMGLTDMALMLLERGARMHDSSTGLTGMGWCRREGKLATLRALQMHHFVIPQQALWERIVLLKRFQQWALYPSQVQGAREAAQRARAAAREALLSGGPLPSLDELIDLGGEMPTDFVIPTISTAAIGGHGTVAAPWVPRDRLVLELPVSRVDAVERKVNEVLLLLRTDKL